MKFAATLVVSCATLLASATAAASVSDASGLIIKLHQSESLAPVLQAHGLALTSRFGLRPIYRVDPVNGAAGEQTLAALRADGRVVYAEPNHALEPPNSLTSVIWAVGDADQQPANVAASVSLRLDIARRYSAGAGVTVAVLDTGLDASHPALAGRVVSGRDFVDNDNDASESADVFGRAWGHGTLVSGLIASVAPQARLMPLRVLDANGRGNVWVLAEAIAYAVDPDGDPQTHDGADVINLSLGTTSPTHLLRDIVQEATCKDDDDDDDWSVKERCERRGGVVVVAAAGNSGNEVAHYPAAEKIDGVLAVAALSGSGLAPYSTRGDFVNIAAPGTRLTGPVPGGGYATWSGSSLAAGLVSGVAALMRSGWASQQWPKATDVASQMISSGSNVCGAGMKQVDAAAALTGTSGPGNVCP